MSKQIDLSKPLSEDDRAYLVSRGRTSDILIADGKDASAETAGPSFDATASAEELLAKTPHTGDVNAMGVQSKQPVTTAPADAEPEPSKYDDLTKQQLEDELERRELPKSGKKPDLIARLVEDDAANADDDDDEDEEDDTSQ